jgi:hypothetical protein
MRVFFVAFPLVSFYNPPRFRAASVFAATTRNFPSGEIEPMQGKKSFLALSTAFAALFVGCEWTGSADSDSWSNEYDAMNFSGTYRAVTTATTTMSDTTTDTTEKSDTAFASVQETGGTFAQSAQVFSGKTSYANIVPGSFQASSSSGYVWNDNGNGGLVFTDPNSGATTTDTDTFDVVTKGEELTWSSDTTQQKFDLAGSDVVASSLVVDCGGTTFQDNGSGALVKTGGSLSATGTIAYDTGSFTLTFNGKKPEKGTKVSVSYKYTVKKDTQTVSATLSGSGTVLYSSGAWSLQIKPAMPSAQTIVIRYSYYIENSSSTATYTTISTTTGNEVSALTVSQSGQNLTITLNNGIVMTGKFTNVQQTGKINEDTNEGYNTYNAQFQVQTTDNKMVGSLNYDLQTGFRMLNGTWTWGKNTYDVQARGPAWKNSADTSTLSIGSITR